MSLVSSTHQPLYHVLLSEMFYWCIPIPNIWKIYTDPPLYVPLCGLCVFINVPYNNDVCGGYCIDIESLKGFFKNVQHLFQGFSPIKYIIVTLLYSV